MTQKTTVIADAEWEDGWWIVTARGYNDVFTQARRLDQVPGYVAEVLHLMHGVPVESVEVTVEAQPPPDLDPVLRRVETARAEAARASTEAGAAVREAAEALRKRGLTQRDTGRLLGISFQRVSQLLRSSASGEPSPRST